MTQANTPLLPTTVFIVGADASKEAELPIGSELTSRISACLNFYHERGSLRTGDGLVLESLQIAANSGKYGSRPFTDFTHAGRRIAHAMPQAISIDNFLDVHNDDKLVELCGKLAIVRTILQSEAKSIMKVLQTNTGPTLSFRDTSKTYFNALFQLITENCKFVDLPERLRQVCFVVFNYDRCIEHYLHYAICNYYSVSSNDATEAMNSLRVFHPYGTVGTLPTQAIGPAIGLGTEPTPHQLLDLASRIKTFTEGTDPAASDIIALREVVRTSTRVVFLGFAFHKLNVQLLAPELAPDQPVGNRKVFGTAHGLSTSDLEIIANELASRMTTSPLNVALRKDLKCADLFGEYRRSLSFA